MVFLTKSIPLSFHKLCKDAREIDKLAFKTKKFRHKVSKMRFFLAGTVSLLYEKHSTDVVFKPKKKNKSGETVPWRATQSMDESEKAKLFLKMSLNSDLLNPQM
jgi:hypothetical protein